MKKQLLILALLSAAVICQAAPNAVFSLDFTKSQVAQGGGKKFYPYPVKTGKNKALEIDKVKGLIVGEEKASAYYSIPDLLKSDAGSVELVVRNLNWEVNDRKKHLFMQAYRPGTVYFYKHSNDGVAVYVSNPETKKSVFVGKMPKWQKDTEHHLVFTWGNGEVTLFIDGIKAASKKFVMPEKMPGGFTLGTPGKHALNSDNTAVKLCRIYDSTLSAKEVSELCKNSKPQDSDIIEE